MSIANHIRRIADFLDAQGKADVPISVPVSRRTLLRNNAAHNRGVRGGALFFRDHEIVISHADPACGEQVDWIDEAQARRQAQM